ncbi:MAG: adenylosuccinate synthase [Pseudomonadota bacterium]
MPNLSIVGAQWGDEGKGKVVDHFAQSMDMVVRFSGGNNAGHTLVVDGRKLIVHLVPSGVVHEGCICLLGDGMVIDLAVLLDEMAALEKADVSMDPSRLWISGRAHLILPFHRHLDAAREQTKVALGTTKRGVGPAYEDKAARRGLRVCDLLRPDRLRERLRTALDEANARLVRAGSNALKYEEVLEELLAQADKVAPHVVDGAANVYEAVESGKSVLFEGAQGVMLDLDRGTYPFVTSSTTMAAGACAGVGIGAHHLSPVVGVAKAYLTRVGDGPMPTELFGAQAEMLRKNGGEYGATTGRPRRCGWLDLPALRYAIRVAGLQYIALTKLDVLSGLSSVPVCYAYRFHGEMLDTPPLDPDDCGAVDPVFRKMEGFGPLDKCESFEDFPKSAREYVEMIEQDVGVPICLVSVGPSRDETIILNDMGLGF